MGERVSLEEAKRRKREKEPVRDAVPAESNIDGAALLDEIHAFLGRFVAYPSEHARVAHALWIVHSHFMNALYTSPRLAFMSAEKESGKTRALEVSDLLVPGPIISISISPAAMVRKVAAGGVTILYDEIDALFGSAAREESNLDVRSILNGGYRRGAKVHRCVTHGKKVETEELDAFAPVALAGLRDLPDTLASRSIIIRMQRRAPDEHVESFRLRKIRPAANVLKDRIEAWAASTIDAVAEAEPDMPSGIVDRAAECWEPLFAVADMAGGEWPKLARAAATHLIAGAIDNLQTTGTELLEHIRDAFGDGDKVFTDRLLQRLHDRDESPWKDVRGKPLTDRGLATRLRHYRIKSKTVRIGTETRKGYEAADFQDVWNRYLPLCRIYPSQASQASHLNNCNDLSVTDVTDVTDRPQKSGNGVIQDDQHDCSVCGRPGAEATDGKTWFHATCAAGR